VAAGGPAVLAGAGVMAVLAAGAAAAGAIVLDGAGVMAVPAAGAAAGAEAPVPADLLMPPWPLQAPRPPWGEVVPSLQVTGPELDPDAGALELAVVLGALELAAAAAGAAALPPAALAVAVLSTPPCPLQAPRPACAEVVPSLQIGGGAELLSVACDSETAGSASSTASSSTP
jgi:hypothetical protein